MDPVRFEQIFVTPDASIREAIEAIDAGGVEIALVSGADRVLQGTVSDGDVRRAMLRGVELDESVQAVANADPIVAPVGANRERLLALMRAHGIEQVPLIDNGRVVDLAFIRDLVEPVGQDHSVVVMAGGEGRRLRPLTSEIPKPMLAVGGRPLLETLLEQVRDSGFTKVMLAVNYGADQIQEHFGEGGDYGVDISYLRETTALGSGGAIRLARAELDKPFIVLNADLLTNVNLHALLRHHIEERNSITIGLRQYAIEVPYGVVETDGTRVTALREKPSLQFFINAGIYAVSPDAVQLMPADREAFNMTDVVDAALVGGARVGSFAIREYWLDIGQLADYERADAAHATYFAAKK